MFLPFPNGHLFMKDGVMCGYGFKSHPRNAIFMVRHDPKNAVSKNQQQR